MALDPSLLGLLAQETGFDPLGIEKVLRLKRLLNELRRHRILRDKLVLKGGTAINVFHSRLPRLSVDLDLDYIGQVERQPMLRERPLIDAAVTQVCRGLRYRAQRGTHQYALLELYLSFTNHAGRNDQLQVEINFLMRVCCLDPTIREAVQLGNEESCRFPVLALEELMASKLKAMIERNHPRDLYDLYRLESGDRSYNREILQKLATLFASTLPRDLREYAANRYETISQQDVERLLYSLLRADDRPSGSKMIEAVSPLLSSILDPDREKPYLDAMAKGKYRPELLFPNRPDLVQRISRHPALLWKAENVAKFLTQNKLGL